MLTLNNVKINVGPVEIIPNLSLTVNDGETVALAGRNGAGRTTIIAGIMGLIPKKSGSIKFDGEEISKLPPDIISRLGIGFAPAERKLFPDLTVEENIQIALWSKKLTPKGKASHADIPNIEDTIYSLFPELRELKNRRTRYLSGGQGRMVAVSRALAMSPSLLLLDEPLEGLAPVVVLRLIDRVGKIKELGISILIAESNIYNAAKLADRIYYIERGEVAYEGSSQKALKDEGVLKLIRGF